MHEFAAPVERVLDVDDRGERVEVELDELGGVLGDVRGLGDDDRDRLADEAHVAVGERAQRRGPPASGPSIVGYDEPRAGG